MRRNWKRILSLLLTVAMVFTMNSTVFADTTTGSGNEVQNEEAETVEKPAETETVEKPAETETVEKPAETETVEKPAAESAEQVTEETAQETAEALDVNEAEGEDPEAENTKADINGEVETDGTATPDWYEAQGWTVVYASSNDVANNDPAVTLTKKEGVADTYVSFNNAVSEKYVIKRTTNGDLGSNLYISSNTGASAVKVYISGKHEGEDGGNVYQNVYLYDTNVAGQITLAPSSDSILVNENSGDYHNVSDGFTNTADQTHFIVSDKGTANSSYYGNANAKAELLVSENASNIYLQNDDKNKVKACFAKPDNSSNYVLNTKGLDEVTVPDTTVPIVEYDVTNSKVKALYVQKFSQLSGTATTLLVSNNTTDTTVSIQAKSADANDKLEVALSDNDIGVHYTQTVKNDEDVYTVSGLTPNRTYKVYARQISDNSSDKMYIPSEWNTTVEDLAAPTAPKLPTYADFAASVNAATSGADTVSGQFRVGTDQIVINPLSINSAGSYKQVVPNTGYHVVSTVLATSPDYPTSGLVSENANDQRGASAEPITVKVTPNASATYYIFARLSANDIPVTQVPNAYVNLTPKGFTFIQDMGINANDNSSEVTVGRMSTRTFKSLYDVTKTTTFVKIGGKKYTSDVNGEEIAAFEDVLGTEAGVVYDIVSSNNCTATYNIVSKNGTTILGTILPTDKIYQSTSINKAKEGDVLYLKVSYNGDLSTKDSGIFALQTLKIEDSKVYVSPNDVVIDSADHKIGDIANLTFTLEKEANTEKTSVTWDKTTGNLTKVNENAVDAFTVDGKALDLTTIYGNGDYKLRIKELTTNFIAGLRAGDFNLPDGYKFVVSTNQQAILKVKASPSDNVALLPAKNVTIIQPQYGVASDYIDNHFSLGAKVGTWTYYEEDGDIVFHRIYTTDKATATKLATTVSVGQFEKYYVAYHTLLGTPTDSGSKKVLDEADIDYVLSSNITKLPVGTKLYVVAEAIAKDKGSVPVDTLHFKAAKGRGYYETSIAKRNIVVSYNAYDIAVDQGADAATLKAKLRFVGSTSVNASSVSSSLVGYESGVADFDSTLKLPEGKTIISSDAVVELDTSAVDVTKPDTYYPSFKKYSVLKTFNSVSYNIYQTYAPVEVKAVRKITLNAKAEWSWSKTYNAQTVSGDYTYLTIATDADKAYTSFFTNSANAIKDTAKSNYEIIGYDVTIDGVSKGRFDDLSDSDFTKLFKLDENYPTGCDYVITAAFKAYATGSICVKTLEPVEYTGRMMVAEDEYSKRKYNTIKTDYTLPIEVYDSSDETSQLEFGTDYTLSYKNTTNASVVKDAKTGLWVNNVSDKKRPQVIIKGKNKYKGLNITMYFDILPKAAANADIDFTNVYVAKKGNKAQKLKSSKITYSFKGYKNNETGEGEKKTTLNVAKQFDTTLYYKNNDVYTVVSTITNPGEYAVKYTGKGNFTGVTDYQPVYVVASDSAQAMINAKVALNKLDYNKTSGYYNLGQLIKSIKSGKTDITDTLGSAYKVNIYDADGNMTTYTAKDNKLSIPAGTYYMTLEGNGDDDPTDSANAKLCYGTSKKFKFTIKGKKFGKNDLYIALGNTSLGTKAKRDYNGTGDKLTINSSTLTKSDFNETDDNNYCTAANNAYPGTYKLVVSGKGMYYGSKATLTFTRDAINAKDIQSKFKFDASSASANYNVNGCVPKLDSLVVSLNGYKLTTNLEGFGEGGNEGEFNVAKNKIEHVKLTFRDNGTTKFEGYFDITFSGKKIGKGAGKVTFKPVKYNDVTPFLKGNLTGTYDIVATELTDLDDYDELIKNYGTPDEGGKIYYQTSDLLQNSKGKYTPDVVLYQTSAYADTVNNGGYVKKVIPKNAYTPSIKGTLSSNAATPVSVNASTKAGLYKDVNKTAAAAGTCRIYAAKTKDVNLKNVTKVQLSANSSISHNTYENPTYTGEQLNKPGVNYIGEANHWRNAEITIGGTTYKQNTDFVVLEDNVTNAGKGVVTIKLIQNGKSYPYGGRYKLQYKINFASDKLEL